MYYYGILYRMKVKDIRSRQSFLSEFLELPTHNQLVGTLRYASDYSHILSQLE